MEAERKEQIQKMYDRIEDVTSLAEVENLLRDNKIEWAKDGKTYRVRPINNAENQELGEHTRKRYLELINDETYLFKKNWVEIYKKKDIDILALESSNKVLQSKIDTLLLRLAVTEEPKEAEDLKKQINDNKDEIYRVSIDIANYLQYSVEEQIKIFGINYQTYIMLEVKDGENWKRAFNSFQEFIDSKDDIVVSATYYASYIIYGLKYEIDLSKKTS